MKKAPVWIALAITIIAAVGILADPTQLILGKLAGDAFFRGRPTRYWARQLRAAPANEAEALSALEQGRGEAVPVLVEMLGGPRSPDRAELRWKAAELLAKLGPDAAQAAPTVAAGVDDPDSHVRAVCASALPKLETPADTAVPVLTSLLKTENVVVAERALSQYRGGAASAIPELVALLNDKRQAPETRWNAARTIGKIGPGAIGALPALLASIDDDDWHVREHCSEAIGELGADAAEQGIPALVERLSDSAPRVRRDAVRSLGQFGEAAQTALPRVKELLDDQEEIVRDAAKTALKSIAPAEAIPDSD